MPAQVPISSVRRVHAKSSYAGSYTEARKKVFFLLVFIFIYIYCFCFPFVIIRSRNLVERYLFFSLACWE